MENDHVIKKEKMKVSRVFSYSNGNETVSFVLHTVNFLNIYRIMKH